jgi:mannose-1-phosphate guanylyltransferase/mannose-6-phosphate isomerase
MRLHPEPWAQARNISIDYAIMEKSDQLMAVPYHGRWSDMGDWRAVWQEAEADEEGVVISGNTMALGCTNSYLRSHMDGPEVVGIGLDDTVVVATSDAVLVSSKSNVQEVKLAVDALKAKGSPQADSFPRDQKPWGWYETLALSDRFQVKRIVVKPGAALSLQSHVHRSEHWIVVSGTAQVTVEDDVKLISENESVYIPLGAKHRLENPGKLPMVLIEVQTGAYLGEDDIVRYEDAYART